MPHHTWDEERENYRQHWQQRHAQAGGRWEDVEPGYRYGHETAHEERFTSRSFRDAESDLRAGYRDWSRERGYREDESAWEKIKDSVEDAWNRVRH